MYDQMKALEISSQGEINVTQLASIYGDLENISVDYLIMERAPLVYTIPGNFGWSDIGNWKALHGYLQNRDGENVVQAEKYIIKNSKNCLIRSSGQKLIVVNGLEDYCIVENEDVIMIYPLAKDQEIKKIRQEAEENFGEQYV